MSKAERMLKKALKLSLAVIADGMLAQYCAEDLGITDEEFDILEDQLQNIVDELCRECEPGFSLKGNIDFVKQLFNYE